NCTDLNVMNSRFNDATTAHISVEGTCDDIFISGNLFGEGIDESSGIDGNTPTHAVHLAGTATNCRITNNGASAVMAITEAGSSNGNFIAYNDPALTYTLIGAATRFLDAYGNRRYRHL